MLSQDLIVAPTQGRPPALIEGSEYSLAVRSSSGRGSAVQRRLWLPVPPLLTGADEWSRCLAI